MSKFTADQRAEKCILPLETALYRACKDMRGSTGAIAELHGLNQNTFALKLNPERTTHHLNPSDIEIVIAHTRDPRILDSVCAAFSNEETTAHWFEVPTQDSCVDVEMLNCFGDLASEVGNLGKTLFAAVADGHVDRDEYSALKKCLGQLNGYAQAILARAEKMKGTKV